MKKSTAVLLSVIVGTTFTVPSMSTEGDSKVLVIPKEPQKKGGVLARMKSKKQDIEKAHQEIVNLDKQIVQNMSEIAQLVIKTNANAEKVLGDIEKTLVEQKENKSNMVFSEMSNLLNTVNNYSLSIDTVSVEGIPYLKEKLVEETGYVVKAIEKVGEEVEKGGKEVQTLLVDTLKEAEEKIEGQNLDLEDQITEAIPKFDEE